MARPRSRIDPALLAEAFAPDGLHGVSGEEIARRLRIAKPTLYAHAGSKDALFLGCVEAEVERLLGLLTDADLRSRNASPRKRLAALARAVIDHGTAFPASARLLHRTAAHTRSSVAVATDAALERIPARLAALVRADTSVECAERLAPALLGAAAAHALAPPDDPAQTARMLGDAFFAALEVAAPPGHVGEPVETIGLY